MILLLFIVIPFVLMGLGLVTFFLVAGIVGFAQGVRDAFKYWNVRRKYKL